MKHAIPVALGLAGAITVAAVSGCDLGDVVRVQTPHGVQQATGLPGSMTLNEAETQYRLWYERTRVEGLEWRADIERSAEVADLLAQLTLRQLDAVGPAVAGVPVLGPALPLLAGLAGLVIRRPGDVSKDQLRKEKEASYNAGIEKGQSVAGYVGGD